MTQEFTQNEAEVRRFLLGELSETERTAFEENFIADEYFFEQIRVVEDELIESYTRGTLAETDKAKFERNFLITEKRRQRVAFTRSMLDKLAENRESAAVKKTETAAVNPSVWNSIVNFFKIPQLAFGATLAITLAAFGGWFLLKNSNQPEIARQTTPTPMATIEIIQANANQSVPSNQNSAANSNLKTPEAIKTNANNAGQATTDKNSNTQKEKPVAVNPVLALFAGTVRSEGATKTLNLPEKAESVTLQLNLESVDYKIYLAEIVNADGKVVAKSGNLRAGKSKINFSVPAAKFLRGDYLVKLSALNPQNENESVADYTFRVNRK